MLNFLALNAHQIILHLIGYRVVHKYTLPKCSQLKNFIHGFSQHSYEVTNNATGLHCNSFGGVYEGTRHMTCTLVEQNFSVLIIVCVFAQLAEYFLWKNDRLAWDKKLLFENCMFYSCDLLIKNNQNKMVFDWTCGNNGSFILYWIQFFFSDFYI